MHIERGSIHKGGRRSLLQFGVHDAQALLEPLLVFLKALELLPESGEVTTGTLNLNLGLLTSRGGHKVVCIC